MIEILIKSFPFQKTLTYDPTRRISAKEALDHPYFDDLDKSILPAKIWVHTAFEEYTTVQLLIYHVQRLCLSVGWAQLRTVISPSFKTFIKFEKALAFQFLQIWSIPFQFFHCPLLSFLYFAIAVPLPMWWKEHKYSFTFQWLNRPLVNLWKLQVAKKVRMVHIIGNQDERQCALDVNIQAAPLLCHIYTGGCNSRYTVEYPISVKTFH